MDTATFRSTARGAVAASTSPVLLIPAAAVRGPIIVQNDSGSALYLIFGVTGTTTDYSVKVAAGAVYESSIPYTGSIYAVWDTADGLAYFTEFNA
jgi:hypothetical protein